MKSQLQNSGEIKQLIADCVLQKRKAQYQFFKRYFSSMMNVCLRYASGKEEAEDMLNEGFIKIFANLKQYEETGSFEAWLRQVMAHSAIDYRRKQ
ncbi:MAG: sigma-70 family RNA polymerase sigma factor, partial [Bacteroidales bacterium]|nr:sigma-70 family RNA polymerase sigma factor [Bacteroidales bacterium]